VPAEMLVTKKVIPSAVRELHFAGFRLLKPGKHVNRKPASRYDSAM
jgi:hypothetical protein